MKIHDIKNNPDYIAKVVTGVKGNIADEPFSKKKLIYIGLAIILTILILTPIVEYVVNKESSLLSKILSKSKPPEVVKTATALDIEKEKNLKELLKLKKANEEYKNKNVEVEEKLKGSTNELNSKTKEVVALTSKNSEFQTQIASLEAELSGIKGRKKKLEEYTKKLMEKKETPGVDMKKIIKFKVEAEKRKVEKEKKKILKNLNQKEKELEKLKIYVEKLKTHKENSNDNASSDESLSELKNKVTRLKENMHYNSGTFYEDLNMFEDAITEYSKAIEINPKASDAHYNIAVIYDLQLKDKKMALFHYRKYLQLEPDSTDKIDVKMWIKSIEDKIK